MADSVLSPQSSVLRPRASVAALRATRLYEQEISAPAVARRYGLPLEAIVDLSLNVNPLGPSPRVVAAVQERLGELNRYPDVRLGACKEAIGAFHGLPPQRVFLGDGLDEVIKLIAMAFLEPGDEVVIPVPTFPRYELECLALGAVPRFVPLAPETFELPLELVLAAITPRTRIVWLCTPNNPTSAEIGREHVRAILAGAAHALVVVDEAMIYPLEPGCADLVGNHPNLLVLRTFSKYYGLAGLRVGYALGQPALLETIDLVRPPFNVNLLAEAAVPAALADRDYLVQSKLAIGAEIAYLEGAMRELRGLRLRPTGTTVALVDCSASGRGAAELAEALARRGVLVVDCRSFRGLEQRDLIRISIGLRPANERLVEALRDIVRAAKVRRTRPL